MALEGVTSMSSRKGLHPTQVVAGAFTAIILLGTFLLWLPISSAAGTFTGFMDALFTSTSAVTVTGLGTLDTETHWSTFGHWTIALLIQIGGFGIVGFASLVGYLLEGRISLKNKMTTTSEASLAVAPDVKSLLKNIAKLMLGFQLLLLALVGVLMAWDGPGFVMALLVAYVPFHMYRQARETYRLSGFGAWWRTWFLATFAVVVLALFAAGLTVYTAA